MDVPFTCTLSLRRWYSARIVNTASMAATMNKINSRTSMFAVVERLGLLGGTPAVVEGDMRRGADVGMWQVSPSIHDTWASPWKGFLNGSSEEQDIDGTHTGDKGIKSSSHMVIQRRYSCPVVLHPIQRRPVTPSPCRRRHHPGTQKQPLFIRCLLFSEAVSGCRSHLGRLLRRRFFFGLGAVIQLFRRLAMFDAANTEIWTELSRRVARKRSRSFLSDSNGRDRLCRCVTTSRQLNRIACHPVSSASVYFRFQ